MKKGAFVIFYPILRHNNNSYIRDISNVKTFEICMGLLDQCSLVARTRSVQTPGVSSTLLDSSMMPLVLQLPDYGAVGIQGWINLIKLLTSFKIRRKLRELLNNAEFIYTEVPSIESWMVARQAKKLKKKLTIEMRAETTLNTSYMRKRFGVIGVLYSLIIRIIFSYVRAQTNAGLYINKSLLKKYPLNNGYQAAICDAYLPNTLFVSTSRQFHGPAMRFLHVGNVEKVKCLDLTLRALNIIKRSLPVNWTLDVVGDGPDLQNIVLLTERLGLSGNVRFAGRIPWGERLFSYYRDCDILLVASDSETGPRTMLEGMAAGIPVISTSVGMAPDVLSPECIVPAGKTEIYAQKILKIAADPKKMTELSRLNRKRAEDFRSEKILSRRTEFFKKVIEREV